MQQTVVAARSTIGEVFLLYQQHLQTTHGAVAGRSRSGNTTTYDDDIIFLA